MKKINFNYRFLKTAVLSVLLFSCEPDTDDTPRPSVSPRIDINSISSRYLVRQAVLNDYTSSTDISDYFRSFFVHFDFGVVICKINGQEIWRNVTEWNHDRIILERTGNRNMMSMEIMNKQGDEDRPKLLVRISKNDPGFDFLPEELNTGFYEISLTPFKPPLAEQQVYSIDADI